MSLFPYNNSGPPNLNGLESYDLKALVTIMGGVFTLGIMFQNIISNHFVIISPLHVTVYLKCVPYFSEDTNIEL